MPLHGNSNKNMLPHHLYELRDLKEDDVFKYGISDEEIGEDGLSKRPRNQVRFLNLAVNWIRYVAKIILFDIPGKKRAKEIENGYIQKYKKKNGKKPRGNLR